MIYFIQAADGTGPIKIGHSIRPEKRLASVQTFCPIRLQIIRTFKGRQEQEIALHRRFAHLRLHGEWFSPASELMDFINDPDEALRFLELKGKLNKEVVKTLVEISSTNEARGISKNKLSPADSRKHKRLAISKNISLIQSIKNENPA